jgi:hypothetical protein
MRLLKPSAIALLAAAVTLSACDIRTGEGDGFSIDFASGKAQDTWKRSYKVEKGGRLELINVNGRISAEAASGDSVELSGERIVKASSDERAKELLDQLEMKEDVDGSKVRVEVRTAVYGHRPFGGIRGFQNVEVRWTVKVPQGVQVDLKTTNGGVQLNGLQGDVHAQTTNGGVTGKHLASTTVEASAVNGGIEIELARPLPADGRIELETVNGGVTLELPESSHATINARAVNGGVRVTDLDVTTQGEPSKRRLDGTLNGGGAKVSLETTNGGVRLARSSFPGS